MLEFLYKSATYLTATALISEHIDSDKEIVHYKSGMYFTKTAIISERTDSGKEIDHKLTKREREEVQMIEQLIIQYFTIIRKQLQDSVPKTIMFFMVSFLTKSLSSTLISELYVEERFDNLLQESEVVTKKRERATKMLMALNEAQRVLSSLRDIPGL